MEEVKAEDASIKTIVRIKGNLLEKVKNKLNQKNSAPAIAPAVENDSINNNHNNNANPGVKKEVQSAKSNVIIHTVEKVQIDVASILKNDTHSQKLVDKSPPIADESSTQEKGSQKILAAKMPENQFNKTVPLKMIRKINKPPVNLNVQRKRFGNVQVHTSQSLPTVTVQNIEDPKANNDQKKKEGSPVAEFKGFDSTENNSTLDDKLKLWKECLLNDNIISDILSKKPKLSQQECKAPQDSTVETMPSTSLMEISTSQLITDSMVDSSMMREFADELKDTAEASNIETEGEDFSDDEDEMEDSEEEDIGSEVMDCDEAYWLSDVVDLIGGPRIREIDKELKKIPSIVTGNKIQAENVELKLIINHLLKKLNKQSVVETLDTEAVNNQHENDEDPTNDDNSSSHSNNYDDQPMDFDDDLTNNASNNQNEEETITNSPVRQPTQQLTVSEPAIEISQVKSENSSTIQIVKNLAQKRKNEHEPLATSTVKKMKPAPSYDLINIELKKSPEKTTGRRGRTSKRPLEQIKEAVEVFQEEKKRETRGRPKKDQTKIKEKSPSPQRLVIETQVDKPRRQYSKLVSDHEISSNEMKLSDDNLSSRLAPSSSTSQPPDCESRSNALEYPSSPSSSFHLDTRKNILISKTNPIIDEVKKTVRQKKKADVTYREPVKVEKRPYLKTSAFTGNIKEEEEVNATDHSSSVTPDDYEVSTILNESPEELSTNDTKQNLQNLMNSLINGEDAIKKNMLPISPKPKHSKEKRVVEKKKTDVVRKKINMRAYQPVPKRVFEQEPLENADNRRVPYVEIIESKRISDPPRSEKGKAKWHIPAYTPAEIKKLRKELEMLDYFQCGMCNFLVTKHKWKDHLFLHGGFAYIEGFETPLNILDFNESVRRMIHYARIYKMEIFRCPHCNDTKKSALGQLSHLFTCGEDLETLELRKMKCELCDAHIMPFSMSAHTKFCKGVKAIELMHQIKAEEEDPSDEEYTNTGRKSRKAVKKAIENFKKMTADERMEHICTLSDGVSKCHICDEKFVSQKLALEHLKSVHGISKETNDDEDDNMSSADEYVGLNASDNESESDGSSGVDDNESVEGGESGDEDRTSDNGIDNSKGRAWKVDSEETKKSRKLVAEYMEVLKTIKIPAKLLELQRDFINDILSPEIFPLTIPHFVIESSDLSSFLTQLNFKPSSMHFLANEVVSYETEFEKSFEKQSWLQLKLGSSHVNDNFTQIFYCGGSVSSLDWAPSNSETNFLAVACNNKKYQAEIGLEQTSTACIQIYEFQSLVNEGFHNFEDVKSSLIYSFAIDDGPVWSIKFHPCGYANSERIGILAVTTSQQNVLVFSLPYLKDEKSSLAIRLEPSFICRISEELMLYQDAFLLQATRVEWHYEKDLSNVLIVGYVNGYVALFNFDENDDEENVKLPETVIQAHRESISAVDVKIGTGGQFFLLTASIGRVIKLFSIDHTQYEEVAVYHPTSRTFCAKFAPHWPAYVIGNDNCYALGNLTLRQPFEFANKNFSLMTPSESIMCLDVCRWTSAILFGTESGDVLGCQSRQLVYNVKSKDPWGSFKNSVHGYTDLKKIPKSEGVGIVFNDLRANITKKPKKFRVVPSELSNQLQINHVCFNRNENSYRFYALAYETGFIRIKHMKNSSAK